MSTAVLTGYADAAAVIAALDLAVTSIQPTDLAVPTGVGQADGLMTHEDKARLDAAGDLSLAALHAVAYSL
jgi:hypothetical protein